MFSQACVKNSVGGGACMARRHAWQEVCVAGGIHVWWGTGGAGGQVIKRARSEIISSMAVS